MSKLRINCFAISVDGYGAGPDQSLDNPLGIGGERLHEWMIPTKTFQSLYGSGQGTTGLDDEYTRRGMENIGAWILGRNMFGPVRGSWPDEEWRGWWGSNPPYHVPVFVLTHHARAPIAMEGGTVFHFITGGIEEALDQARAAANGKDIRLGGGVGTLRQYLRARLVDEMHLAQSPILLGAGENLFNDLNLPELGYELVKSETSPGATHLSFRKG